jgi:hypothetical protein
MARSTRLLAGEKLRRARESRLDGPSWTETLLECGCEVVGRNPLLHSPGARQGHSHRWRTKSIDWDKVGALTCRSAAARPRGEYPVDVGRVAHRSVRHSRHIGRRPRAGAGGDSRSASLSLRSANWPGGGPRLPHARRHLGLVAGPSRRHRVVRPRRIHSIGPFAYLIWRDPWMAIGPGRSSPRCSPPSVFACAACSRGMPGGQIRSIPSPIPPCCPRTRSPGVERAISLPSEARGAPGTGPPVAIVDGEIVQLVRPPSLSFLEGVAVR